MGDVSLGLLLDSVTTLRRGRTDDPVDVVLWSGTLVDPPRAAAARKLRVAIEAVHPRAELVPYAWCLVTHGHDDLAARGSRTLAGDRAGFGRLQDTPEVERAWEVTRICAEALGAQRVVLSTPPGFAPGSLGRRRLSRFSQRRRDEGGPALVWEPQGLWGPTEAQDAGREAGLDVLLPAFEGGRILGEPGAIPGWIRVDGPTPAGGRLEPRHVEDLVDAALGGAGPRRIVFGGPRAHAHLREVARVLT